MKPIRATIFLNIRLLTKLSPVMKKIDILNFITDFRKSPNDIKTYAQLVGHLGTQHESTLQAMLVEMKQMGAIKEIEQNGAKAYHVAKK